MVTDACEKLVLANALIPYGRLTDDALAYIFYSIDNNAFVHKKCLVDL
jgi:hypothetical protein